MSVVIASTGLAQTKRCGTNEYMQALAASNPGLASRVDRYKTQARQFFHNQSNKGRRTVITIPVVVHVMHNGDPVGTGSNISDAQILSQIEVLNEDYRALNTDLTDVPSHFTNIIGDVQVEFCLASFDPEGNPTNGIDRVNMGTSGTWSDSRKPGTIWDNSSYLNIWVADIGGGTLGYATFPGTTSDRDGVVIDYEYFGRTPDNPFSSDFNLGRTATHEIGHWLGLDHTFQGGCAGTSPSDCDTQGDRICDTPPTANANYGCSLLTNKNSCQESPVDLPDMWMNFMDYMDDACLLMFTQEQADVMIAVLNTSRASIKNSLACDNQNLFSYAGQVIDANSGQGVAGASVLFTSSTYQFETTTDANGNFNTPNFREGTYGIYAGKWGYTTIEFSTNTIINDSTPTITIPIAKGYYYDDFILDYGWTVSGNATTGIWDRAIPLGTSFNNDDCNPGEDVVGDYGETCYVTGNGGGSAGNDDVDDGNTVLMSPLFNLTDYNEPYLSYYRWFYNDGGQGNPNDVLTISISNGDTTTIIEELNADSSNTNRWTFHNIRVGDYIAPTATMHFIMETADQQGTGHLVEAGLDVFSVVDSMPDPPTGLESLDQPFYVVLYPNPARQQVFINITQEGSQGFRIYVYDITGKLLDNILSVSDPEPISLDLSGYHSGVYLIKIISKDASVTKRLIIE